MSSGELAGDAQGETGEERHSFHSLAQRGGSLDLGHEPIVRWPMSYLLVELVHSAPVPYPANAPGTIADGLLLRMCDGRARPLVPDDIAEAQRVLDLNDVRRPDLHKPSPPNCCRSRITPTIRLSPRSHPVSARSADTGWLRSHLSNAHTRW